jgi:hypothetical protein
MTLDETQKNIVFVALNSTLGAITYVLFFRAVFYAPGFLQVWILPTIFFLLFGGVFMFYSMVSNISKLYFVMIGVLTFIPFLVIPFVSLSIRNLLIIILTIGVIGGMLYQISHGIHIETQERLKIDPKRVLRPFLGIFIILHMALLTSFLYFSIDTNTDLNTQNFQIPQSFLDRQIQFVKPFVAPFTPDFELDQTLEDFLRSRADEQFEEGLVVDGVPYEQLSQEAKIQVNQRREELIESNLEGQVERFNEQLGTEFTGQTTLSEVIYEYTNLQINNIFGQQKSLAGSVVLLGFFLTLISLVPILSPLILLVTYVVNYIASSFDIVIVEERMVEKEDLIF